MAHSVPRTECLAKVFSQHRIAWCLPGCPNGPFLPPWCLPRASQPLQLFLSCLPGASLVLPRLYNWSFLAFWCRLVSNYSSPASLLPPWRLPGCRFGPFLPPWCLPGLQLVLSCPLVPPWCLPGCPIGPFLSPWCLPIGPFLPPWYLTGCPIGPFLPFLPPWCLWGCPPLSKFQWRPARFAPNPGVGPTAVEQTASQRPSPRTDSHTHVPDLAV